MLVCLALGGCEEVDPLVAIRRQQASGDYAGSIEPLRALLATRPDDPEVNVLYGRALAFTQRQDLASWPLRKAMEDPAWFVSAGTQLALVALGARDFNEAVKITGQILEREPENLTALLMRANAHAHWKKEPELALADAKRVLELDPARIEAYEPLILALLALERFDEASEALAEAGRRLVELGGAESVLAWHCSTTAAFQQEGGELGRARATWAECLDAYPTDMEVVTGATAFFDEQGEPGRSLDVLRAALAEAPASRVLRVAYAQRLSLLGDVAEADAVLREATQSDNPLIAAAAWADLGEFRLGVGERDAAADALGRAVELTEQTGPASPELLFKYADALLLAGRLDDAFEIAEEIPVPAQRELIRARVAQERRDPEGALARFDEALELWPDNPWARYYAALAAAELGDFDRALAEFRYAIRISPGATDARTLGAAMLFAQGQPNSAMQLLYTAHGEQPLEPEGQLLFMRLSGLAGNSAAVADALARIEQIHPSWAGRALAAAAEGVAARSGPGMALSMLLTAPVDYSEPRYAAGLRALVRFSHQTGEVEATREALAAILEAEPDSGALQAVRALDLELSGASEAAVRAAYESALSLEPENPQALAGLGRRILAEDPESALALFDRAAAADPTDPELKLLAAKALVASGRAERAAERLDALLLEHPFEAAAAAERAWLDLESGIASERTLERARRAVRFGGGAAALELLAEVHERRGEPDRAARAAQRARELRDAEAAGPAQVPGDADASEG